MIFCYSVLHSGIRNIDWYSNIHDAARHSYQINMCWQHIKEMVKKLASFTRKHDVLS